MQAQAPMLIAFALLGPLAGCSSDHEATPPPAPTEPVARGAYALVNVTDDCTLGSKLSFCTSEAPTSIDIITVADPSVASIMRMEELTQAEQVPDAQLVIDAQLAGTTSVTIESTFNDGSHRTAQGEVVVQDIDGLRLWHECGVDEAQNSLAIPVGRTLQMWTKLLHGETALRGEYQGTLLEGEGLKPRFGNLRSNSFLFTSAAAGTTELTSPLVSSFSQKYRSYTPSEATIAAVELKPTAEASYHDTVGFSMDIRVDGARPCYYPPLRIETQTPEVCDGEAEATSWVDDHPGSGASVRAVRSGTCKFTLAIEGNDSEPPYLIETALTVTSAPSQPGPAP